MARSKATRPVVAHETTIASLAMIKQRPLPHPQGIVNLGTTIQFHPDLVQAPQIGRYAQVTLINPHVPRPVLQPEVMFDTSVCLYDYVFIYLFWTME